MTLHCITLYPRAGHSHSIEEVSHTNLKRLYCMNILTLRLLMAMGGAGLADYPQHHPMAKHSDVTTRTLKV